MSSAIECVFQSSRIAAVARRRRRGPRRSSRIASVAIGTACPAGRTSRRFPPRSPCTSATAALAANRCSSSRSNTCSQRRFPYASCSWRSDRRARALFAAQLRGRRPRGALPGRGRRHPLVDRRHGLPWRPRARRRWKLSQAEPCSAPRSRPARSSSSRPDSGRGRRGDHSTQVSDRRPLASASSRSPSVARPEHRTRQDEHDAADSAAGDRAARRPSARRRDRRWRRRWRIAIAPTRPGKAQTVAVAPSAAPVVTTSDCTVSRRSGSAAPATERERRPAGRPRRRPSPRCAARRRRRRAAACRRRAGARPGSRCARRRRGSRRSSPPRRPGRRRACRTSSP